MKKSQQIIVSTAKGMKELGGKFAKELKDGVHIILLEGLLGAGKTTFAQGFAQALGVKTPLTSPTFTIINTFPLPKTGTELHHIDLYRIHSIQDLAPLGMYQILSEKNTIVLIEWSNKHPELFQNLPYARVAIKIQGIKRKVIISYVNA